MTRHEYVDMLAARYEAYYDVRRGALAGGKPVDLIARSLRRSEKYFLSKKITLWAFETCVTAVVKAFDPGVTAGDVDSFCEYLKNVVNTLVEPSDERVSTVLNGVMVCCSGLDGAAASRVKRFSHTKSFSMGLRGWCHLGLIAVDLECGTVYYNRAARPYEASHRLPDRGVRAAGN
ncbi:MAG: hypothetical protein HPY55_08065 [Firmicutes bacterium]|nr:hypothetical protein [Bacillota bacterium]